MTEDSYAHVVLRILVFHALGKSHCTACDGAFSHKHNRGVLALAESALDKLGKLIDLCRNLGNDGSLGTCGDSAVESKEACIATHHLDEEESLVRCGSVAYFIHALHDGVECSVVSNGFVGAIEVVIDSAGQTDNGEIELSGKYTGTGERTVTANHHEGIDTLFFKSLIG